MEDFGRRRIRTIGLLVLIRLRLTAFENANIIYFYTKQATLKRRSNVISLPLQLVFPGYDYLLFMAIFLHNVI
jgi:hypothetical protein